MDKKIRTRFAPSPTGYLHIGGLRTALFSYAYAKSLNGEFILRIEDTDRKRYVPGATEKLMQTLKIFGLAWDEGPDIGGPHAPYIQSERVGLGIYRQKALELVQKDFAYYCFCPAKEKDEVEKERSGKGIELRDSCRYIKKADAQRRIDKGEIAAIRLRVPDNGTISFYDEIVKKEVCWNLNQVDEAMLLKSDGFPTYHLAVVVDDMLMEVTHILRGFEWLPSTPIHLLLFKNFGYTPPKIGHFPIILDPEGGKLSKRKRNVSCEDFLKEGFLPEAILNYVMLLGWSPKDNREFFSLEEFVSEFQKGNIQKSNAVFDPIKLAWMNQHYIQSISDQKLSKMLVKFAPKSAEKNLIDKITPLVKTRMEKLSDFNSLSGFFFASPILDKNLFGEFAEKHLDSANRVLTDIKNWNLEDINQKLMSEIQNKGYKIGDFFMDLRIAVTGKKITPPINESIEILGREETLKRIREALGLLTK